MLVLFEFERVGEAADSVAFASVNGFDDAHAPCSICFSEIVDDLAGGLVFWREAKFPVGVAGEVARRDEGFEALVDGGLAALDALEDFGGGPVALLAGEEQKDFQMFERLNMSIDKC